MTQSTRAVVFTGPNQVLVQDVPAPPLRPDAIRVRVEYSGVSIGTEMSVLGGMRPQDTTFPCVPGYQSVGVVEAVGEEVVSLRPGDRVLAGPSDPPPGIAAVWGGHISHAVLPASRAVPLAQEIHSEEAALAWVAAVAHHGVMKAKVGPGELVAVIGQGMIGQMVAQIARLRGARVVASDRVASRVALSARWSADVAVDAAREDLMEKMRAERPAGADAVIECTGLTRLLDGCVEMLRPYGRLSLQGWYAGDLVMHFHPAHLKEITMIFPFAWGQADLQQTVDWLLSDQLHIKPLITHVLPADQAPFLYLDLLPRRPEEALGVILDWQGVAR